MISQHQAPRSFGIHTRGTRLLTGSWLLAICLGLLCTTSVHAWKPINTQTGATVRWPHQPIHWFYNHNGFTQGDQNTILSVFQAAFQKWEQAGGCTGIKFQYSGTTTRTWNSQDQRNVLIWNNGIPSSVHPTALALTVPLYSNDGVYLDSDIIFNAQYQWSLQPTGQQFDVLGTSTHEIGHFIGLDHTNVTGATMYPTAQPGLCPCRTLKQDDISGVCTLYPGSNTTAPKRQVGQPCSQSNTCDTGLICMTYQQGAASGVCHKTCPNGTCLSGEKCYSFSNGQSACICQNDGECGNGNSCQNYFCTGPAKQPEGTKELGESCDNNNLCKTGLLCVQVQQNVNTGICLNSCPNDTCATGEKCYPLQNGTKACACLNNDDCSGGKTCTGFRCAASTNQGGKEGEPCDAQGLCQTGLQCVRDQNSTQTLCVRPCAADTDCVNQYQCHQQFKVCVPPQPAGTRERGQDCDPQNPCKTGLQCILLQQNSSTGVCFPSCQGSCADGEKCVPLQNGTSICVCLQNNECPTGKVCQQYRCVDGATCSQDSQCTNGLKCIQGKCTTPTATGCTTNAECPPGSECQNGACVTLPPPTTSCTPACSVGFACVNGSCIFKNECRSDNDCGSNETCTNQTCQLKPTTKPPVTQPPSTQTGCCQSTPTPQPNPIWIVTLIALFLIRQRRS